MGLPGGIVNDGTSCTAIHVDEDVDIVSKTKSPNQGTAVNPSLQLSVIWAWVTVWLG